MKKRTATGEEIKLKSMWLTLGANDLYNGMRNLGRRWISHFNRAARDDDGFNRDWIFNAMEWNWRNSLKSAPDA